MHGSNIQLTCSAKKKKKKLPSQKYLLPNTHSVREKRLWHNIRSCFSRDLSPHHQAGGSAQDYEWSLFRITSKQLLTAPFPETMGPEAICSDSSAKNRRGLSKVMRVGSNKTRESKFSKISLKIVRAMSDCTSSSLHFQLEFKCNDKVAHKSLLF